jgi:dTDP-glucose pyrophosphorylase
MAGAGARFAEAGYTVSKPLIPVTSHVTGEQVEMIVAAAQDAVAVMGMDSQLVFVMRDFHIDYGIDTKLKAVFHNCSIVVLDHLTDGQARTCLTAREYIDPDGELLIGACDCGFRADKNTWQRQTALYDSLVITHSNDENIRQNPSAHSWLKLDADGQRLLEMSIKHPLSEHIENEHATTGIFWFKKASYFLDASDQMIQQKDQIAGEYYVDKVPDYLVQAGCTVSYIDVDYFSYGTPADYEWHEKTIAYWQTFLQEESEHHA